MTNPATIPLLPECRRADVRDSPYAPRLKVVQALTISGHTVSGAGHTLQQATLKCIGETAEYQALFGSDKPKVFQTYPPHQTDRPLEPIDLKWAGLAAGPDTEFAALKAVCERIERHAILAWWNGHMPAYTVSDTTQSIAKIRKGAILPRATRLAFLEHSDLTIAIAYSCDSNGKDPILGYGCALNFHHAIQSALQELCLMELNLLEKHAVAAGLIDVDLSPLNTFMEMVQDRLPTLFENKTEREPPAPHPNPDSLDDVLKRLQAANHTYTLFHHARPLPNIIVVQAAFPDLDRKEHVWRTKETPFL